MVTEEETTTMQVHKSTLEKLEKLKIHPRETWEEVVLRLIERNCREA